MYHIMPGLIIKEDSQFYNIVLIEKVAEDEAFDPHDFPPEYVV